MVLNLKQSKHVAAIYNCYINLLKPGGNVLLSSRFKNEIIPHGVHIAFVCHLGLSGKTATFASFTYRLVVYN